MAPGGGGGDPSPASTEFSDISMSSPEVIAGSGGETSTKARGERLRGGGGAAKGAPSKAEGAGAGSARGPSKPTLPEAGVGAEKSVAVAPT